MGWTYHDSDSAYDNWGSDDLVLPGIAISDGDLIVVGCGGGNASCTSIWDDLGHSYTLTSQIVDVNNGTLRVAYCTATAATTSLVISCGVAGDTGKSAFALSFTPDAGDTISYDTSGTKGSDFEASPWESGVITTTGTDEVCVAWVYCGHTARTYLNQEIPSAVAATSLGSDAGNNMTCFYKIGTVSNGAAEVDNSTGDQYYCAALYAFKSEAAGGGGGTWVLVRP